MATFKLTNKGAATKHIRAACIDEISRLLTAVGQNSRPKISVLIALAIFESNVYRDIPYELGGKLGFLDGQQRIDKIIKVIDKQIYFDVVKRKDKVTLYFKAVKKNYDELLNDPLAWFITEKGTRLEWLRWMLLEGTEDVIVGYHFTKGNSYSRPRFSRTGYGFMREGGEFFIPYVYAGDMYDNFIIRAMQTIEAEVKNTLVDKTKQLSR